jgi:hypothetical protein
MGLGAVKALGATAVADLVHRVIHDPEHPLPLPERMGALWSELRLRTHQGLLRRAYAVAAERGQTHAWASTRLRWVQTARAIQEELTMNRNKYLPAAGRAHV